MEDEWEATKRYHVSCMDKSSIGPKEPPENFRKLNFLKKQIFKIHLLTFTKHKVS